MQKPLVSILIPFKDTEIFLQECMESIVNQTYENWEVIAIDDGSKDKSLELLTVYANGDRRIKVFENKGSGIIPALRTAYKNCSGILITRMDSDDIMKPDRIQKMVDSLLLRGTGHVAVGQVTYFSEQGISNGYDRYEKWLNGLTATGNNYSEIYKECVIPSPCWMIHKEDLDNCGAFNENRYPEDYDLTFRFYEKGYTIIPCNKVLHLWRDYETRTSRTHVHYAQNYFLDIKLHYFLKLDYDISRPLTLWGAGFKGKQLAKNLLGQSIDFVWLCDNPKKIGKKIYGKELLHFRHLTQLKKPQSIVSVANELAQKEIWTFFSNLDQVHGKDYFLFC